MYLWEACLFLLSYTPVGSPTGVAINLASMAIVLKDLNCLAGLISASARCSLGSGCGGCRADCWRLPGQDRVVGTTGNVLM